jgi:hypothetical protein
MEGDARVRVGEINKMNEEGQNTPDSIRSSDILYLGGLCFYVGL